MPAGVLISTLAPIPLMLLAVPVVVIFSQLLPLLPSWTYRLVPLNTSTNPSLLASPIAPGPGVSAVYNVKVKSPLFNRIFPFV